MVAAFSLFLCSALVFAQEEPTQTTPTIADSVCRGVLGTQEKVAGEEVSVSDCKENENETFGAVIRRIINIFSVVVGAVSVIMIIVGGFRYIISGGDSTGVTGAKNTILYAVVGLVIVLFAQVLVRFIISNISNPAQGQQTPLTNTSQPAEAQ